MDVGKTSQKPFYIMKLKPSGRQKEVSTRLLASKKSFFCEKKFEKHSLIHWNFKRFFRLEKQLPRLEKQLPSSVIVWEASKKTN